MEVPTFFLLVALIIPCFTMQTNLDVQVFEKKCPGDFGDEAVVSLEKYEALNEKYWQQTVELARVSERHKSAQEQLSFQKSMFETQIQVLNKSAHDEKTLIWDNCDLRIKFVAGSCNLSVVYLEERLEQCNQNSKSTREKIHRHYVSQSPKIDLLNLTTGFYYISTATQKENWYTAGKICKSHGLELASVETAEENDELYRAVTLLVESSDKNKYFWLSGSDLGSEGYFYWSGTGHPFGLFLNWNPGQPDNMREREHCVMFWERGGNFTWNDQSCDSKFRYICELKI